MTKAEQFYKLAQSDGFDCYTGCTINYREAAEATGKKKIVRPPHPNQARGLCSSGVIHASRKPNDCFVGADIPCSAYRVTGEPVLEDGVKCGFLELTVIEEIMDKDGLLGWNYTEACNPVNPFKVEAVLGDEHKDMLKEWAAAVGGLLDSVLELVANAIGRPLAVGPALTVRDRLDSKSLIRKTVRLAIGPRAWSARADAVWESAEDPVYAYIGSIMLPPAHNWEDIDHEPGEYPFQPCSDLWRAGFVPSFDGKTWRLHSGEKAEIVYELEV